MADSVDRARAAAQARADERPVRADERRGGQRREARQPALGRSAGRLVRGPQRGPGGGGLRRGGESGWEASKPAKAREAGRKQAPKCGKQGACRARRGKNRGPGPASP